MRHRFVQPEVVRLYLVDVHKRAYDTLRARPLQTDVKKTHEELQSQRTQALADLQATIEDAIADGHYVDVKKQLTAGEEKRLFNRKIQSQGLGGAATVNLDTVWDSQLLAYIVGWSLVDAENKPVPFSESAVDNLDLDTYAEIRDAVDAHATQMDAERTALKNNRGGGRTLSASSPSPSTTAGVTNGSMS